MRCIALLAVLLRGCDRCADCDEMADWTIPATRS